MSNNDEYSCPPYHTYNMIPQERTQTYKQWFASPIYHNDYNNVRVIESYTWCIYTLLSMIILHEL